MSTVFSVLWGQISARVNELNPPPKKNEKDFFFALNSVKINFNVTFLYKKICKHGLRPPQTLDSVVAPNISTLKQ